VVETKTCLLPGAKLVGVTVSQPFGLLSTLHLASPSGQPARSCPHLSQCYCICITPKSTLRDLCNPISLLKLQFFSEANLASIARLRASASPNCVTKGHWLTMSPCASSLCPLVRRCELFRSQIVRSIILNVHVKGASCREMYPGIASTRSR
jgi:hypothetical protein